MKYQPTYDQVATEDMKLNVEHGLLLDMIVSAPVWANKITHDGKEYYYLAQAKIIEELPTVFRSRQVVNRVVKQLGTALEYVIVGRSNYYKVDKRLSTAWGKKSKGAEYLEFIGEYVRNQTMSETGHSPEPDIKPANMSETGHLIGPKPDSIHQPVNPPTNNKPTRGAREKNKNKFTSPSLEEIQMYDAEIGGSGVQCDLFLLHYTSNNWMIGKGPNAMPMDDWKLYYQKWTLRDQQNKETRRENANKSSTPKSKEKPNYGKSGSL